MFNTAVDRERLLGNFRIHQFDEYFSKHYGAYFGPIFIQGYFAVLKALLNAMNIFTGGGMVEVDAEQGIVRKK